MAVKSKTVVETPQMATRTSSRMMKLPSWTSFQMAHWRNTTQKFKTKHNVMNNPKGRPIGSLFIFPSQDPYTSQQRMEFRAVHENVSWINRAIKITITCCIDL